MHGKKAMFSFLFSFLGYGLSLTYNSDIFEKSRPPLGFQNSQIEIGNFRLFFQPPPPLGIFPKVSRFFLVTPPLNQFYLFQIVHLDPLIVHLMDQIILHIIFHLPFHFTFHLDVHLILNLTPHIIALIIIYLNINLNAHLIK